MNKFNVGDVVLYQNGDSFELGVVKEVVAYESGEDTYLKTYESMCCGCPFEKRCHEECKHCDSFLEAITSYKYRVYYHTGDTTALTDECNLHKLSNAYAFNIIRKSASKEIESSPSRQMASRILGQLELYGDFYYTLEDWLTDFLEGNEHDIPKGIESEYLKCALRVEVRDCFDAREAIDISSEDIENVIDELFENFSQNVFNTDFIWDTVGDYIDKNNIKREEVED
jgi:hypothetical protein